MASNNKTINDSAGQSHIALVSGKGERTDEALKR